MEYWFVFFGLKILYLGTLKVDLLIDEVAQFFVLEKIFCWKAFGITKVVNFSNPQQFFNPLFIWRLVIIVKKLSERSHPIHLADIHLEVIALTRLELTDGAK